ncbi:hypothetical protein BDV93DRAFT_77280 [Ceratobasidium sp. AG-I]|nr:hypothetical protein BDV93DRAFT_77280 [Ceratobasidium sp. AG-I]
MSDSCPPAISDIDSAGARNFTLFRRKPRGHELVNGSMAVSRAVLHGSFSWSSRTGPEGRLILKFPLGWQHSLCPVQSWYKTQQARLLGQRPSTTFDTIEHHRSLEGPFFHEFLLIPVSDGSGYRVERTGVGSDADAISPTGCEANDLIEWFPAHKFQPLIHSGQSHLISRFTLDSELDILNVLAGCYSIFQEKQTRGYTLQRYNCYFFCCTILAVLVRRVADWEHIITETLWPSVLNATLERLLRLSEHPASDETRRHVLLRLFHGLHPANQQPTRSLVDALQKVLGSEDGVRDHFNSALASMIWGSDHHLSMSQYLASYVNAAILEACAKDAVCDQVLNVKERNPVDDALVISSKGFNSLYAPGDIAATAAHSAHIFQDVLPALEREHGVSRGARLIYSIGGVIMGLAHAFQPSNFTHTEKGKDCLVLQQ